MGRLVRFPVERVREAPAETAPAGVCVRLRPSDAPEGFSAVFAASTASGLQKASYVEVPGGVEVTWSTIEEEAG